MNNKEQKIYDFCKSNIGQGYIYGGKGQTVTESFIQQQYTQYPSNVKPDVVRKWIGKKAYDCAGFVRMAMKEIGISMVSGATSQWNKTKWVKKDTIDTLPKNKICCLYRRVGSSTMQHTGIYLGNGMVVDARGSSSGVIESTLESYPWTHWGVPQGLYTLNELNNNSVIEVLKMLYKAKVIAASGSTVNMRASASKSASVIAKVPLGTEVEVFEELDGWKKIEYNGAAGFMMEEYLTKVENSEPQEEVWYVRIRTESKEEAEKLAKLLREAEVG